MNVEEIWSECPGCHNQVSADEQKIRSSVECIVLHAITEYMHRIVILDQTLEEAHKGIDPDIDYLTRIIMNEM